MIDFLIVGAGLFGSVVAHELNKYGYKVLVVEKENHVGGMVYTEKRDGIDIHKHGAHIFRTNEESIWNYINHFGLFIPYVHTPMAKYENRIFNLPFNMNTFNQLWGVVKPDEAKQIIESQCSKIRKPRNLEEYALSVVGTDIYNTLIKGYTEKQWGVPCTELPPETMRRIPLRFTYDNNYYSNKRYQGIPLSGYTEIIQSMLSGIDVLLGCDGIDVVKSNKNYRYVIYTGCIDEFFNFCLGHLRYRTLRFEEDYLFSTDNFQGVPVVNYTSASAPFTRIIEHKHFTGISSEHTIITKEYPGEYRYGDIPYYPMLDDEDKKLYEEYKKYASTMRPDIIFCGRQGSYAYTDMEDTICNALALVDTVVQSVKENNILGGIQK